MKNVRDYEALFIRYYPLLCSYARHFVSREDAEEVVQDIMLWLWEEEGNRIPEQEMGNYLFRAVKNRCLNLINRNIVSQKANSTLYNEQHLFDEPDFYVVEELAANIDKAISDLPETYRTAFEKNRFSNMTYQEIADEQGVSPKTIDYRIQQALKLLRTALKDFLPLVLIAVCLP